MRAYSNTFIVIATALLLFFEPKIGFATNKNDKKIESTQTLPQTQSAQILTIDELNALKTKLSELEIVSQRQKATIEVLQAKVSLYEDKPLEKNINYPIWTSILLGSSALLMTVVGIGIAILSFIGYKQIVRKGVKAAVDAASKTAKEAAAKGLDDSVVKAVNDLTDRGYFEPIVNELVQKFMYRGIDINDLPIDGEPDNGQVNE